MVGNTMINTEKEKNKFRAAVLGYCKAQGIEVETVLKGDTVYRLTKGSKSVTILDSLCSLDSHIGAVIGNDKMRTYEALTRLKIPTLPTFFIAKGSDLDNQLRLVPYPAVVKPVDREGGEGVTINIKNKNDLYTGIFKAYMYTHVGAVIQPYVEATNFRLQVLGGQIAYVVHRMAKDLDTPLTIRNEGGSRVELDVTPHPEVVAYCKKIADYFQLHSYGIDILSNHIVHDPGLVLEINTAPILFADKVPLYVESLFL